MTAAQGTAGAGLPARRVVASYDSYRKAERAVDLLADHDFPVQRTAIVGRNLRFVEQVTGRTGYGRAGFQGSLYGALVGVLIGWLFGVFDWFNPVVASGWLALDGLWFGSLIGGLAGLLGHALTRGRRDFVSVGSITADAYDVVVDEEVADQAAALLSELDRPPPPAAAEPGTPPQVGPTQTAP
ncbi:MAG TPA: general stress protein [Solirubrobacteraceae bacterium]|nr:general stress protein [Solirubrobacteraceae bacterium]